MKQKFKYRDKIRTGFIFSLKIQYFCTNLSKSKNTKAILLNDKAFK